MSEQHAIYVTARLPAGVGEAFVITEALALERAGWRVTVIPVRGGGDVAHGDARRLQAEARPVLSSGILFAALGEILSRPRSAMQAVARLRSSRNPRILLKNLVVVPKSLWLARVARQAGASHIHAHWASTSSTMAMLAASASGISWSLTAHRWDIAENNLLRTKAGSACFVRVISEHGARELRGLVDQPNWEPWVLPMGVELPEGTARGQPADEPLRVLAAARLVEKKGHVHLVEAVRLLREQGVTARVDLAGDGHLREALRQRVAEAGLDDDVVFLGTLSHDELLARMAGGEWDVAVLPSVVTASGELEGIPVSLIEAMASGLPVVGTETGGIPELLGGGAGVLVPPADAEALARALTELAADPARRAALAAAGRARVEERFDVDRVAAALGARFRGCAGAQPSSSA